MTDTNIQYRIPYAVRTENSRLWNENEQLKKIFRNQQADPEDLEKRRPQDELIARIKNYTVN